MGSDLAGSIRYPCHCCGVVGLRPTVGLQPQADAGPDGQTPVGPSAAVIGPMARTLPDLRLVWDVLLAHDERGRAPPEPADPLRVAVLPAVPGLPPDRATAAAFDRFAAGLRAAGHAVTVLAEPPFDFAEGWAVWGLLFGYELKAALPPPLRARPLMAALSHLLVTHRVGRGPLADAVRPGLLASADQYHDGLARQAKLRERVADFFGRFDLWVLPVSPGPALVRQPPGRPVRGHSYTAYLASYLVPTAVPGTPALTLPIGRGEDGMPIAAQVHAARFADRWLVRAAVEHLEPLTQGMGRSSRSTNTT